MKNSRSFSNSLIFCEIAFVNDSSFNVRNQRPELYYWDRQLWSDAVTHLLEEKLGRDPGEFFIKTAFDTIFLGHTSTMHWKTDRPMKIENIYNLDTGAGHGGRLTIMNVETKQWFQSEAVHVAEVVE